MLQASCGDIGDTETLVEEAIRASIFMFQGGGGGGLSHWGDNNIIDNIHREFAFLTRNNYCTKTESRKWDLRVYTDANLVAYLPTWTCSKPHGLEHKMVETLMKQHYLHEPYHTLYRKMSQGSLPSHRAKLNL